MRLSWMSLPKAGAVVADPACARSQSRSAAKVVSHGRYATFQMAEVPGVGADVRRILSLVAPAPGTVRPRMSGAEGDAFKRLWRDGILLLWVNAARLVVRCHQLSALIATCSRPSRFLLAEAVRGAILGSETAQDPTHVGIIGSG